MFTTFRAPPKRPRQISPIKDAIADVKAGKMVIPGAKPGQTTVLGKGTDTHKAAVVGDTVGDPFKDTAGPSLHVLVKLLSTVTLVLAPLFIN